MDGGNAEGLPGANPVLALAQKSLFLEAPLIDHLEYL